MIIDRIKASELSDSLVRKWREIQLSNRHLASPFFCPEFTQAVASVRQDVYVAIIQDAGEVVGFFPFQGGRFGYARPVGHILSDCHGLVVPEGICINVPHLLRQSGLAAWSFEQIPSVQTDFQHYVRASAQHFIINISEGWKHYCDGRLNEGAKAVKKTHTALRILERDIGPVRMEHGVTDPSILNLCIQWKSKQRKRTGAFDALSIPWVVQLLRNLHGIRGDAFRGMLSALWVRNTPIAIHFGMCTQRVWNWWFPAYDVEYARHSPGMILITDAARVAAEMGLSYVDLGRGQADWGKTNYKLRLSNGTIRIDEGLVTVPSIRGLMYIQLKRIKKTTDSSLQKGKACAAHLKNIIRSH